jgi:RimJ/RimL family protein N-acetyltransferase
VAKLLGYETVNTGHFLDNPASGRVLRKVGFRPTGKVASRHSCGRGGEAACALYRIDLFEDEAVPQQAA